MRLLDDKVANLQLWREMPDLLGITPVGSVKPGADILMTKSVAGADQTVLAVQPAGNGRVGAFTSGGSWYWQMSRPASDQFYENFWKQMVRWLVVGAHEQLDVSLDRRLYARLDPVVIEATVMDRNLTYANDATLTATVKDPLNNTEKVPLEWILSREGVYQGRYVPQTEGRYVVTVQMEGKRWEHVPPVETGFVVAEPVLEFSNAGLNEDLLKDMSELTQGAYFSPDKAQDLAAWIAKRVNGSRASATYRQKRPLWDMPVLFMAMLCLMGAEWVIRRRGELS